MAVKDINQVVAEQLEHWMTTRKPSPWTQEELAQHAGVAQKTISNYLNPKRRPAGAKGKQGSPKLVELDMIARALGIQLWQLTRDMTQEQRAAHEAVERAFQQLLTSARPADPQQENDDNRRFRASGGAVISSKAARKKPA